MGPREGGNDVVILDVLALQDNNEKIPQLILWHEEIQQHDEELPDKPNERVILQNESHLRIGSQVVIPFFIAGIGMVVAGLYLDYIKDWAVFVNLPETFILVPALLGLKGNLEMTLASRLSTACNLGHMDSTKDKLQLIFGNMALLQCQSTIIGLLAAIVAILMELILRQDFVLEHALILCASSITTAAAASAVLGLITSSVIVVARSLKINPDNIATPVAGSLGDITALVFLSLSASYFYSKIDIALWLCPVVMVGFCIFLPLWIWLSMRNDNSKDVLKNGWTPIVLAMIIAVVAGFVLEFVVRRSPSVAVFQPVVNGIGGNLVAIQASKMSTSLHKEENLGTLPPYLKICISPIKVFFSKLQFAVTARVLMFLVIPGHLCFIYVISFVKAHTAALSAEFVVLYLIAVFIQVGLLIYIATILTSFFWKRGKNPDNMTIPYMTALGDLFGVILLGIVFELLRLMDKDDVLT